ncbi:MAG TPA: hypothetical protein VJR48_01200, partial [Ktedonobacterales bacterium]|nr:hypothetical protein [Ktedonobacterales bacterium]
MRAWRFPPLRAALALLLLALLLAGMDALCYRVTLPVELDAHGGMTTLTVDGQRVVLGALGQPVALTLAPRDPVVHEYQLDGTDSTNNFTLDLAYLHNISDTSYYRFQSWMRDLDGLSRWGNLHVWAEGHEIHTEAAPPNGANVTLPAATSLRVTLELQRPETPVTLVVTTASGAYMALIDRNDRAIIVTRFDSTSSDAPTTSRTFFPMQSAPFAAMVFDFLVRTLFWGVALVLVALAIECWLALTWFALAGYIGSLSAARGRVWQRIHKAGEALQGGVSRLALPTRLALVARWASGRWRALTAALHPLALAALAGSLIFVAWIARVEYASLPHIYDASAYLFGAKIYATGHLWLPVPPASDRFPGPFMALHNGKWFPQYVPGTSLLLA